MSAEVVHQCPPGDEAFTPCCGKNPLELPRTDRLTEDQGRVTCGLKSTMMRPRLRITSNEDIVRDAKIEYIRDGEDPVDLSRNVTGATIILDVGEIAKCELRMIFLDVEVEAEVTELLGVTPQRTNGFDGIKMVEHRYIPKDDHVDVTTIDAGVRRYMDARPPGLK